MATEICNVFREKMEKMNIIIKAIVLLLLPATISRIVFNMFRVRSIRIGKGCKIGYSIILSRELIMDDGSSIGHFNILKNCKLKIGREGKIKHLNFIKGYMEMVMDEGAWINSQNKIAAPSSKGYHIPVFFMKQHAAIIMKHTFDVTDDITLGEGCLFAGSGSQVWTHAFYLGEFKSVRVDGAVNIGKKCYIGSSVVICAGVSITDNVAIGANTTIAKDIYSPGLYVNQPLRFIEYDADKAIGKLGEPVFENRVYRKNNSGVSHLR